MINFDFKKQLYGNRDNGVKVFKDGDHYIFEGVFDSMMEHGRADFSKQELIEFLEFEEANE